MESKKDTKVTATQAERNKIIIFKRSMKVTSLSNMVLKIHRNEEECHQRSNLEML